MNFNVNDRVLIPAVVRVGVTAVGVIVETGCENTIVELTSTIIPDYREGLVAVPFASVEGRVEKMARAMAIADDVNPDDDATSFTPDRRAGGWVIGGRVEAWRLYARYARAVIDAKLA